MFKALIEKKERFDELHKLISDPKVIANNLQYQKYAKELASLKGVIEKYEAYQKVLKELQEARAIVESKHHDSDMVGLAKEEIKTLEKKKKLFEDDLIATLTDDPDKGKDIIMEIRAGTGGLEASLFAADLFRIYSKYVVKRGWKMEMLSSNITEKGGFKEVIFSVSGQEVYGDMRYESGTHRVQRVPETEASGRIHTSAATVAVFPEAEEVDLEIDPKDIEIDVFRSGGAGGQHVNVTDSAVRITHKPSGLVVSCQDERSQHKNKAKAMRVLRTRLMEKMKEDQASKRSQDRKIQVGSGDRSEKIRTYNFPDGRVTDHRIGLTIHDLENILEGDLDKLVIGLKDADRKLRLAGTKKAS